MRPGWASLRVETGRRQGLRPDESVDQHSLGLLKLHGRLLRGGSEDAVHLQLGACPIQERLPAGDRLGTLKVQELAPRNSGPGKALHRRRDGVRQPRHASQIHLVREAQHGLQYSLSVHEECLSPRLNVDLRFLDSFL